MEKCKRMKRPQFVKELNIFLTTKVLEDKPAVYRSESFAMKTDILMNGSTVKNHISLNTGFGYNVTRRTSFRSWLQACQRVLHPTGESSSYIHLKLVFFTNCNSIKRSDREIRERKDQSGIDSYPVPVSSSNVEEMMERGNVRSHFGSSHFGSRLVSSQVFVCCVHRMAPFACRPIIKCGKSGCTGSCPLCVVEYGYEAGRKPATCRVSGKTFPRPNVTLSNFFPVKSDKKKGNNSRNVLPSRLDAAETPHLPCLDGQVLFPGVTHRAILRHQKVRMQSWRTARSLIRLRSTGRSEQTTNYVKFSRTCQMNTHRSSTVTVSRQKCSRWMMRKWPCWLPRGNSHLCKVGLRNKRISKEIETKQQHRLEILHNGSRLTGTGCSTRQTGPIQV